MNDPGRVYLSLKLAARLFGKSLESLTPDERQRVSSVASRQQQKPRRNVLEAFEASVRERDALYRRLAE